MSRLRKTHCLRGHKRATFVENARSSNCPQCEKDKKLKYFNFDEVMVLIKEGMCLQEAAVKMGSNQRRAYAWRMVLPVEQKAILDKHKVRKQHVMQTKVFRFTKKKWKSVEYPADYLPTLVPGKNNLLLKAGA